MSRKSSNALEKLRSAVADEHFDAVIDFSAYDSDVVKDTLKVLEDQIKLYIYISTDSVYEVGRTFFLAEKKIKKFNIRFVYHRPMIYLVKQIVFDQQIQMNMNVYEKKIHMDIKNSSML